MRVKSPDGVVMKACRAVGWACGSVISCVVSRGGAVGDCCVEVLCFGLDNGGNGMVEIYDVDELHSQLSRCGDF